MVEPPPPRPLTASSRAVSAALSDVSLSSSLGGSPHHAKTDSQADPEANWRLPHLPEALDPAAALELTGGWGLGQASVVAVMGFAWILMAASFSLPVFIAAVPDRTVKSCSFTSTTRQQQQVLPQCRVGMHLSATEWCDPAFRDAWVYDRQLQLVTAEWDIVCENRLLASSVGSSFFFGVMGGNAVFSPVPDRIGRCRTFVIAAIIGALGASVCAEAQSFAMYLMGRLWAGFGFGGLGNVAWIIASEVVGKEYLSIVMLAMNGMWACGIVLLTLLTFPLPAWRSLSKVLALGHLVLCVLGSVGWYQGLDTPPWLAAQGREEDFHLSIAWLARKNGRPYTPPLPGMSLQAASGLGDGPASLDAAKEHPGRCSDIICKTPVAFWTLRFVLAFCCCALGYYGLSLNAGNLAGDVHVSTILTGIVEIPALLAAKKLADHPRIGRRGTVVGGVGCSGIFCLVSAALPAMSASATAAAVLGKLFVSAAFCTVIMQAGEAYPATTRGFALGVFSTCSRVAGMLAPVVVMLPPPSTFLVIGAWLTGSSLLLMGLPETLGRTAPATATEACQSSDKGVAERQYEELGEDVRPSAVELSVIGRRVASES